METLRRDVRAFFIPRWATARQNVHDALRFCQGDRQSTDPKQKSAAPNLPPKTGHSFLQRPDPALAPWAPNRRPSAVFRASRSSASSEVRL